MTSGLLPPLTAPALATPPVFYPESDGEPMADNTKQFVWIIVLYGNLAALFRDTTDVFVGGNQNWFPRQGEPELCKAPDVYVVFGRPKGHRTSWKQWEEGDIPLTIVFEVLSPKNTWFEMAEKLQFYDDYGVEEYYVYDPEKNTLAAYRRGQAALRMISLQGSYTSPRLGIRFDLSGPEMAVFYPDGRRFLSFEELDAERQRQQQRADTAEQRANTAEQRASSAEQRASSAEQRTARLAELSRKARRQQATPQEMEELERLESETSPDS
jgi:Uma2 family endonuclease